MISVIVPYKNSAAWLARCINSLRAQQPLIDAEFILVNDHSDDDGVKIAEQLTKYDRRFALADNHYMPGPSGARNTGLDYACGDWITFLDSDDEMMPDALETYQRMIDEYKGVQIHMSNHYRYYAKIDKTALKYTNEEGIYTLDALPTLWCMVWNKCYKANLINENGIRFEETMRYGEDEIFNLECLAADNRIHHSPSDVATVKRHFDNRESLAHIKDEHDLFKQAAALVKFIHRHHDNPTAKQAACRILSEHWGSDTYLRGIGGME